MERKLVISWSGSNADLKDFFRFLKATHDPTAKIIPIFLKTEERKN